MTELPANFLGIDATIGNRVAAQERTPNDLDVAHQRLGNHVVASSSLAAGVSLEEDPLAREAMVAGGLLAYEIWSSSAGSSLESNVPAAEILRAEQVGLLVDRASDLATPTNQESGSRSEERVNRVLGSSMLKGLVVSAFDKLRPTTIKSKMPDALRGAAFVALGLGVDARQ